jgi:hypothetical protein
MGSTLLGSLPNELMITCIWAFIFKINPLLPRLNVLCNFCAVNKVGKNLVDSSFDWDCFIWVSLETTLDQQIVDEWE